MVLKQLQYISTIDRMQPHVKFADEAVWIGESPINQYLLEIK
jgi:acetyl/propionyl-CoA carboxylase alpha subunit